MKKTVTILTVLLISVGAFATNYTIAISGNTYSPAELTVKVGDQVTIKANGYHPLRQVDELTWAMNGSTALSGGWGTTSTDYTFTVNSVGTIYFICTAHIHLSMKGKIIVEAATDVADVKAEKEQLTIFPSPAQTQASFTFNPEHNGLLTASIYNMTGQVEKEIYREIVRSAEPVKVQFSVAELPSGIYFLVLSDEQQRYTRRFAVAK
ncbi:MAG: T9SS type A sorting domain-containing protein [Bacteroidales bacterium]